MKPFVEAAPGMKVILNSSSENHRRTDVVVSVDQHYVHFEVEADMSHGYWREAQMYGDVKIVPEE